MPEDLIEELTPAQCVELLGQERVGRVGITVGALPVILPVNFSLLDGAIIFRTIPGTQLAAATSGTVVAFEVDSYEGDGRAGWSVLVRGIAAEVTDPTELEAARAAQIEPWGASAANRVVRVELRMLSGRRCTDSSEQPRVAGG